MSVRLAPSRPCTSAPRSILTSRYFSSLSSISNRSSWPGSGQLLLFEMLLSEEKYLDVSIDRGAEVQGRLGANRTLITDSTYGTSNLKDSSEDRKSVV